MGWIIFGAIAGIIINIALCDAFAGFAGEKGYDRGKYFWMCFFFGILGYVWVAGLPDIKLQSKISQLERDLRNTTTKSVASQPQQPAHNTATVSYDTTVPQNGNWRCKCGRKNPPYVTTCVCGTSKYNL